MHRSETGYYLNCFAGGVRPDVLRRQRSSGGMATWFLRTLLKAKLVDRVVHVRSNDEREQDPNSPAFEGANSGSCPGTVQARGVEHELGRPLFQYAVSHDVDDLAHSAKSCYYPVEMSEVIRQVLTRDGRCAVIGLPCFLKALRLAMRQDSRLAARIVVLAGLACGGTRSRLYAHYLCRLGGGSPEHLMKVDFRSKVANRPASEFNSQFVTGGEPPSALKDVVVSAQVRSRVWSRRLFQPSACGYCDDVFAEVGDIVFLDAWLERYTRNPCGTSFILVRRSRLTDMLKEGAGRGEVSLEEVAIEDLILSQQGVIDYKRRQLAERLYVARRMGLRKSARKRVGRKPVSAFRFGRIALQQLRAQVWTRLFAQSMT